MRSDRSLVRGRRSALIVSPFALPVVVVLGLVGAAGPSAVAAPTPSERTAPVAPSPAPDATLAVMRGLIERYDSDRANLRRFYDAPMSRAAEDRRRRFCEAWLETLAAVDLDALDSDGRIDAVLFRNHLDAELRALEADRRRHDEIEPLVPFARTITRLEESRRAMEPIEPEAIAAELVALVSQVEQTQSELEAALDRAEDPLVVKPTVANRAARMVAELEGALRRWYRFYDRYDPLFTWWVSDPYEKALPALDDYRGFLRRRLVGVKEGADETDAIIGDPIGRDELLSLLASEMIPYTPEELIAIADREYEWCRAEMIRASRELGYGDDWRAALDHVKTLHVAPGAQPALIRDLALEAVEFLEARDLVTIPDLCKETWRMQMMSPARQKVSPYFLGGEVIIVSFPTDEMAHEDKLMSMRGNNVHFARATVHHELIPGHHLQGFMRDRYRTHRRIFATPFWGEGWALYWEMRLWDLGFPLSPENRIGMLFWRTHRCARIAFSLRFHLEQMTAAVAIDYLVENVGHERNNATAEVRRSVSGDYGPLYQAAYMLGGLQIRALHAELVESGRMTEREFHDAILRQNSIPIEMVRAALTGQKPPLDFTSSWRFYGEVEPE